MTASVLQGRIHHKHRLQRNSTFQDVRISSMIPKKTKPKKKNNNKMHYDEAWDTFFDRYTALNNSCSDVIQSTLVIAKSNGLLNASRYPYLDISDLQN